MTEVLVIYISNLDISSAKIQTKKLRGWNEAIIYWILLKYSRKTIPDARNTRLPVGYNAVLRALRNKVRNARN